MTIKIRHSTNILSSTFLKDKIIINGTTTVKIKQGEEKYILVNSESTTIQIKQFWGKSNVLEVSEGDSVEIGYAPWLRSMTFIGILLPVFIQSFTFFAPTYFLFIIVVYIAVCRIFSVYTLSITSPSVTDLYQKI